MESYLRILTPLELPRAELQDFYDLIREILPLKYLDTYNGYKIVHNKIENGHVYTIPLTTHLDLEESEMAVITIYENYKGDFIVETSVEDQAVEDGEEIECGVGVFDSDTDECGSN